MNFITFVFSLLLIISFGTSVILEKQSSNQRLRSSYLGHIGANRKLLSKQVSETYRSLRGQTTSPVEKNSSETSPVLMVPEINPDCARLNLWPLIQEGKQTHPYLYSLALQMIECFYKENVLKVKPEIFLNSFLKQAKLSIQKQTFSLEKLKLDPSLQLTYYKMLKGAKEWNMEEKNSYPSFLDVFKVDENLTKICIYHAHPGQLNALFGKKIGNTLYQEIHVNQSSPSKELFENVYAESHLISPDPDLYQWLDFAKAAHSNKGKTTLVAKDLDTRISLRKTVYLP